jgi:hypothetical protein
LRLELDADDRLSASSVATDVEILRARALIVVSDVCERLGGRKAQRMAATNGVGHRCHIGQRAVVSNAVSNRPEMSDD